MLMALEIFKKQLIVLATAILPFFELKLAIPMGVSLGLNPWVAFVFAYLGTLIPVPILLYFLKPIMSFIRRIKPLKRFANWLDVRTKKKSEKIEKYSLLGLFIFVAVPLPGTGVWSGAAIASFLDMKNVPAFFAITLGNLVAGIIVMLLTYTFV